MKISIVTINFNQSKYIENAIQSVINQSYKNYEYIIIDGGSVDNSVEIIKKYQQHLHCWVSEKDSGPADALNKGFEKATGDLFFYLNSDDQLVKGAFEKIINYVRRYPSFDIYYGHGIMNDLIIKSKYSHYSDIWNTNFFLNGKISVFQPSTFIRKDIFKSTNGFNIKNTTCWDAELLVDCALKSAKFKRTNEFYSEFTLHSNSITGSQRLKEQYISDFNNLKSKTNFVYKSHIYINIIKLLSDTKIFILKIFVKIKKKYLYAIK